MEIAAVLFVSILAMLVAMCVMQSEINHLDGMVKHQSGEIDSLRHVLKNILLDMPELDIDQCETMNSESKLREILAIGDSDSVVDAVRNLKLRYEMTSEAFMRQELAGREAISRKLQNED